MIKPLTEIEMALHRAIDRAIEKRTLALTREASEATVVICMLKEEDPGDFIDNSEGVCHSCRRAIIHRPYLPEHLTKMCIQCATEMVTATRN